MLKLIDSGSFRWFSTSTDLYLDAQRDLADIGANMIPVINLGK